MSDFDAFWNENIDKYKKLAMQDFLSRKAGPWCGTVHIDPDDDFELDIGDDLNISGTSFDDVRDKIISSIRGATVMRSSTWSIRNEQGIVSSGDRANIWIGLREEAIRYLLNDEPFISLGGNQTIDISIHEKGAR